jgi:hypothetical protein
MKAILQKAFEELHKQGGKPPQLTAEDKPCMTLKYIWEYRTMESIGADYGAGKSAVCESIQWVEDALDKDKSFRLPDKRILKKASPRPLSPSLRTDGKPRKQAPQKPKRVVFRQEKRHTIKTRVIIERKTKKIIDVRLVCPKGSECGHYLPFSPQRHILKKRRTNHAVDGF